MDRFELLRTELTRRCPGLELREEEPMARHTSFHIGGPARLMALPRTEEEARETLQAAWALEIPPFFLGNGSNLLVADRGYEGFVVKPAGALEEIRALPPERPGEKGRLEAGGAALLSRLSKAALDQGLTGLEFAQGIPGSVGGGVTMNAGAYGGEMQQVVHSATVLFPDDGVRTLRGEELRFSYRHSLLTDRPEAVVLRVVFQLTAGRPEEIRQKMEELMARRKTSQPLEYPSAGSTFKRPEGYFAAALIDQCGLKGMTVGGAQVSEKHAGFVINRGGATCADVTALMAVIQRRVWEEKGVRLEPEVKIVK